MSLLLAKSKRAGGATLSLLQHLTDTRNAVDEVFADGSRWRRAWLRFFKIAPSESETFWRTLRVAALFHDVGKANADFQNAVTNRAVQSIRHEHLSAVLLCFPSWRAWLADGGVDADLVTATVLSHHIKAARAGDYKWCQPRTHEAVELLLEHPEVHDALGEIAKILKSPKIPTLPEGPWRTTPPWSDALVDGVGFATRFGRQLRKEENHNTRRFLAGLKAGLIVADSVASAMFREGKSMSQWLAHNAHLPPLTEDAIRLAITEPRARQIEEKKQKPFKAHRFQELVGNEGPRSLLTAPCGAGKTLAAWEWAKRQARGHAFGRVIFLYPTRGTATEGFRDYVGWAPEGDATLLHGSSEFELASIAGNPPDSLANKDVHRSEAEARMFALGLWRFAYFSATVDQFLSFMQNRYQSLCLLPALADAVLILDEVHSYDASMFDMLISFLREFDVPVLCMTATLPRDRARQLAGVGLTPFPRPEHAVELQDLADTAEHPRYHVRFEAVADSAIESAIRARRDGKHVLVVVNRVARCLEVAKQIARELGYLPLVYHSRFRLCDRQLRHAAVVTAFTGGESAIAVTTQVCEMSLDLDAEVLVTELAPVSSLIQRFGRANRHLKDRTQLAEVIVYPPAKAAPYETREIDLARQFVQKISGNASQAQLARMLDALPADTFESDEAGQFLTGGYFAVPGSFRDEDQHSMQCICDTDLSSVRQALLKKAPIDGYIIPAPRHQTLEAPPGLPRYLGLVDGRAYSSLLGLEG